MNKKRAKNHLTKVAAISVCFVLFLSSCVSKLDDSSSENPNGSSAQSLAIDGTSSLTDHSTSDTTGGNMTGSTAGGSQTGLQTSSQTNPTAPTETEIYIPFKIKKLSDYVPDESVWRTPLIDKSGFVFEVALMSNRPYYQDTQRKTIRELGLGGYEKIPYNIRAYEWGNDFHFVSKYHEDAGTKSFKAKPPATRQEAFERLREFVKKVYIKDNPHPWSSMVGHFEYQHYSAEFGFDYIGVEIGEVINSYQMHLAFTRGAAKQYRRPWFVDFSSWQNNTMLNYSGNRIWASTDVKEGENYGHSINLHERSFYVSYMSGTSWLRAQAGGVTFFYNELDENGCYRLSPLGEAGKKFNDFTKANPDVGIPYTPFGIVLDFYHGTYYGSDYSRKAFEVFPYNGGDFLTWTVLDKFFPDSWKQWGRLEKNALTNSPYGDTCDVMLQNASQKVLNSYPVIILSGDITFKSGEAARIREYVKQGGTLVLNSAYLDDFPEFRKSSGGNRYEMASGNGKAIVYGPDYSADELDSILKELTQKYVPFSVPENVEYIVNIKDGSLILTVVNNDGVTKPDGVPPVIDESQTKTLDVKYRGEGTVKRVKNLRTGKDLTAAATQKITLGPGELTILEFFID